MALPWFGWRWPVLGLVMGILLTGMHDVRAQRSLPSAEARSEEETLYNMRVLPGSAWDQNTVVVLAWVASIKTKTVYLNEYYERRGLATTLTLGGRLSILETLVGQPLKTSVMDVENESNKDYERPSMMHNDKPRPISWEFLRPGQYLLVMLKDGGPTRDKLYHGPAIALNGLSDPLLLQYRRRLAWQAMSDQQKARQEEETMLLDPRQNLFARVGALWMRWQGIRNFIQPQESAALIADRKEHQHLLTLLLAQARLPHTLRQEAIKLIQVDVSKPLAPGSDEALLMRYLLHTIARCPDADLVRLATEHMTQLVNREMFISQYLFPDLPQALEEQAANGTSECAQFAAQALREYREKHHFLEDAYYKKQHALSPPRRIPLFDGTERGRRLKMAAVTA